MENSTTGASEFGTVVVGVDGSSHAAAAALWAAAEADRCAQSLHIVYATDTDSRGLYVLPEIIERIRDEGRELLQDTAARVTERFPGLRVTTELSRREPVATLHTAAGVHGTIVVGSRGLGGFSALLLGSVGLRVAAGARVPVVVVREAEERAETGVVLAAVRDEVDLDCARLAARSAEMRKASLRLLSIWNLLEQVRNEDDLLLDHVDELVRRRQHAVGDVADRIREEFPGLPVTAHIDREASVAGALVEASRDADLLVMGGRRPPSVLGATLGWATHAVLHHAHCPVELVPRDGARPGEKR
ncbi:universal stress protein [Streptomyces sp. NPDC054841]